jgi:hypothetical protein
MNQTQLRQTKFHLDRLKNVVGTGRSTAYQVVTTPGSFIGHLGEVVVPANLSTLNDKIFTRESSRLNGWLKRALGALR